MSGTEEKYYQRLRPTELPKTAHRLSLEEVQQMQWERISEWKPHSEMWPFVHGPGILGSIGILTGSFALKNYRRFFQLGKVGMMTTFIPTCVLTCGGVMILHNTLIQNELLKGQLNCPTCAEVRALSIQLGLGYFYPLFVAPLVTMAVAKKDLRYPLPPLTEPRQVLNLIKKASKPLHKWFLVGALLHIGVTTYVVHKEGQAFAKIMKSSPLQHVR